jgi:hypothetical protein
MIGGLVGTLYGFSNGVSEVKKDINTGFPKLNKNDHRVIASTFIFNPKKIIFHTSIGFFYGALFPLYTLYLIKKIN